MIDIANKRLKEIEIGTVNYRNRIVGVCVVVELGLGQNLNRSLRNLVFVCVI